MGPITVILFVFGYFGILLLIARLTSKKDDNDTFFLGNKQSPWYVVAFGMVGASLSGVTFISVPGWVEDSQFSYFQMVLGYLPGYLIIATILMPLYYRLNLTSIYTYLDGRFGRASYKTGSSFFLLSRLIGCSFRLYLVAIVLQLAVFDKLGMDIPFAVTVIITVILIWVYTFRGGIKTIIWTDTLQTLFMLTAVGVTIYSISSSLNLDAAGLYNKIVESDYSKVFFFEDGNDPRYFWKQFIAGAFITIVMTGLDQDMMQKNLSCRNIGEAQMNMFSFCIILLIANLMFLTLGALLYIYSAEMGIAIPENADNLYPMLAVDGYLGTTVAIVFILGLIAAAYSSADSALTALTTSFCVDILDIKKYDAEKSMSLRKKVHVGMSIAIVLIIILFKLVNNESVIAKVFTVAGYTYGPLLGLYAYGLFTKWSVRDKWVPFIAIASPILSYVLDVNSEYLFNGYQFGFMILLVNGAITFIGLWISSFIGEQSKSTVVVN